MFYKKIVKKFFILLKMSELNIQIENEQSIHNNPYYRKRKNSGLENKSGRKLHEIREQFHESSDKTKIICNICDQSYIYTATTTNLKKHFERFHKDAYIEILNKKIARKNNQSLIQHNNSQQQEAEQTIQQQETEIEKNFNEVNRKRKKYKRIILENVIIEDNLFNLFVTGLDAENIIIQK